MSTTIPVLDLVGKDVRGRKAIVMQPQYWYQCDEDHRPIPVVTLISVDTYREKYKGASGPHKFYTWYRVRWEKSGTMSDCGFSAWREDAAIQQNPTILFVDEENNA